MTSRSKRPALAMPPNRGQLGLGDIRAAARRQAEEQDRIDAQRYRALRDVLSLYLQGPISAMCRQATGEPGGVDRLADAMVLWRIEQFAERSHNRDGTLVAI